MSKELEKIKKKMNDLVDAIQITEANKDDITPADAKNLASFFKTAMEFDIKVEEIQDGKSSREIKKKIEKLEIEYTDQIILLLTNNKYNFELFDTIKKFLVVHGLSENDPALLSKLINLNIKEEKGGKVVSNVNPELEKFLDE